MRKSVLLVVTLMLVLALPAFAGARTIRSGIDLWMTTGDGTTYADFSKLPIPAGFFCAGSEPFLGKVAMRGVARRLDGHVRAIEVRRKRALRNEVIEHSVEERGILGVKAQFAFTNGGKRRL